MKNLESLHLAWTKITDKGVRHLVGLKKLKTLSFSPQLSYDFNIWAGVFGPKGKPRTVKIDIATGILFGSKKLTGKGLAHLKDLPIEELDLSATGIKDDGFASIKQLKSLKRLSLIRTDVTDKGLAHLKSSKHLKTLIVNIKGLSTISDSAIADLRKALPDCQVHRR